MLTLIFEPVLANQDSVGVTAPLAHQHRAGLRHKTGVERRAAFLELLGQALQAAPQRPAYAAITFLLQLMGEGSDQQIATEPKRRSSAMQLAPGNPQILRRPFGQAGHLAFDLGGVRTARPIVPIAIPVANRRRLARVRLVRPKNRGPDQWASVIRSAIAVSDR